MPIIVIQPDELGRIGPGIRIQVTVDVPYPIPVDHQWDVWVEPLDQEGNWRYRDQYTYDQPFADWNFMVTGDIQQPLQAPDVDTLDGQEMRLVVNRREGGVIVETVSQRVHLDLTSGIPYYQQWWDINHQQQGGLTTEQAAQLEETHAATIVQMGVPGNIVDIPVDVLVPAPPLGLQKVEPAATIASGDGFLPGDLPGVISYYGLWWEFVTVPPGIGFDDWPTRLYEQQLLQLRVIHTLDGVDVVSQLENANADRYLFMFNQVLPTRIEFSILPGVEVAFHRVVFLFRDS